MSESIGLFRWRVPGDEIDVTEKFFCSSREMLNLLNLKSDRPSGGTQSGTKSNTTNAAVLRVSRDLTELGTLSSTCQLTIPNPDDLLRLTLTITPDDGYYRGGRFIFSFNIGNDYPHSAPKVKCTQKIYHPNIDLDGNVCLNILREDWNPVLTLSHIILGLGFLFSEPNPDDPLNREAAEVLKTNPNTFKSNVTRTMQGGTLNGVKFDHVLIR